ncbi:hypothetical protein REPUB_Repub01dG0119700 [Reevesia pubescens]
MVDLPDDTKNTPSRTYVRDAKAMADTPADIKEYPKSYVFIVDMPGLKSGDIKVQVEDDNVLLICGGRKQFLLGVGNFSKIFESMGLSS